MSARLIPLAINGRFLSQPTTGVQRVARELTREIDHLVEAGEVPFRVRLLHQPDADLRDMGLSAIEVVEVPGRRGAYWEQVALPRALRDEWMLCLGNTAPISLLMRRRRVALMIHDLSYRLFPHAYRPSYRIAHALAMPMLLNHADPIITVSNTERKVLTRLEPSAAERIVVAQNGGWRDPNGSLIPEAPPAEREYGLYVGSLSQRKNFEGVLAAAIRLAREDGLPFRIVGSIGSILAPTPHEVPSDVADKIEFLGQVEDLSALARIYQGARFLLFPSFYEASPLPPLEAMHFGCPVIASDIPPMHERCGDAAAYCDPGSIDAIVGAVRQVVGDAAYQREMVARGYECAARYSWRAQARTVLDAIQQRATADAKP